MRLRSLLNMRDRMKVYLQRYILMVVHLHLFLFLSLAISINRQLYGWKRSENAALLKAMSEFEFNQAITKRSLEIFGPLNARRI